MPKDPHKLLVGHLQEEGTPDWKQAVFDRPLFEGLVDQARLKEGDMVRHQEVDMVRHQEVDMGRPQEVDMERPREVDMERPQEVDMERHLLVQGM